MELLISLSDRNLITVLEAAAPVCLAEPWDAVGLQIGDPDATVTKLLLTVDTTLETVGQAASAGAQLIVSHHPLLFTPLAAIVAGDPVAEVAAAMIRQGLALYAAHTNLDVAPQLGTAAALAERLGLGDVRVLCGGCAGIACSGGEITGAGRLGYVTPVTAGAFAQQVAATLGAPCTRLYGDPHVQITCVAAIPGAGGDGLAEAAAAGAQVVVTGELKHHELLEARARGLVVVLAGHLQTERPVLPALQRYLSGALPKLSVIVSEEHWPESGVGG